MSVGERGVLKDVEETVEREPSLPGDKEGINVIGL